jgi:hypothetical protein
MVMPIKYILCLHIILYNIHVGQLDHQLLLLPVLEDLKHLNVQLKDLLLDLDPELNLLVTESRFVAYESGLGI